MNFIQMEKKEICFETSSLGDKEREIYCNFHDFYTLYQEKNLI